MVALATGLIPSVTVPDAGHSRVIQVGSALLVVVVESAPDAVVNSLHYGAGDLRECTRPATWPFLWLKTVSTSKSEPSLFQLNLVFNAISASSLLVLNQVTLRGSAYRVESSRRR